MSTQYKAKNRAHKSKIRAGSGLKNKTEAQVGDGRTGTCFMQSLLFSKPRLGLLAGSKMRLECTQVSRTGVLDGFKRQRPDRMVELY